MGRTPRVLVVDDEPPVRKFVESALRLGGYEPFGAANGPDALRIAKEHGPFDLLVTDVAMPGLQGHELTQRLRNREPELKVLYFTGRTDRLFDAKATLWENEAFLEKPAGVRALLEAVSLLLYGHIHGPGREIPESTIQLRSSRVGTAGCEVRVGDTAGYLVNVSASGALVRLARSLGAEPGEWPMRIEITPRPIELRARVVRSSAVSWPLPGTEPHEVYEVGLTFTDVPPPAIEALRTLCADAFTTME